MSDLGSGSDNSDPLRGLRRRAPDSRGESGPLDEDDGAPQTTCILSPADFGAGYDALKAQAALAGSPILIFVSNDLDSLCALHILLVRAVSCAFGPAGVPSGANRSSLVAPPGRQPAVLRPPGVLIRRAHEGAFELKRARRSLMHFSARRGPRQGSSRGSARPQRSSRPLTHRPTAPGGRYAELRRLGRPDRHHRTQAPRWAKVLYHRLASVRHPVASTVSARSDSLERRRPYNLKNVHNQRNFVIFDNSPPGQEYPAEVRPSLFPLLVRSPGALGGRVE